MQSQVSGLCYCLGFKFWLWICNLSTVLIDANEVDLDFENNEDLDFENSEDDLEKDKLILKLAK